MLQDAADVQAGLMPLSLYSPFDERVDFALNRPCAICRWADTTQRGASTGTSARSVGRYP